MKYWFAAAIFVVGNNAYSSQACASDVFFSCDGLRKPGPNDDQLATDPERGQTVSWSEPRAEVRSLNEQGVAACDSALADPRLKMTYVQRHANLLQAKAAHLLGSGRIDEALVTLEASDRIGSTYPAKQFAQGIGLGNRILKGIALSLAGKKEDADVELDQARLTRPWASSVGMQTLRGRFTYSNTAQRLKLLREAAVLNPEVNVVGMAMALQLGDFQTANAMGAGPAPEPLPKFQGYYDPADAEAGRLLGNAERVGMRAYALCALARCAEGQTELEIFEQSLNRPQASSASRQDSNSNALSMARQGSLEKIAAWRKIIELRRGIADFSITPDQLITKIKVAPPQVKIVLSDLLHYSSKTGSSGSDPTLLAIIEANETALKNVDLVSSHLNVPAEYNLLPNVETSIIRVRYRPTTKGAFALGSGFTIFDTGKGDEFGIYFVDFAASTASIEEAALYAAAVLAKSKGFDAIVVTYNRTVSRQVAGNFVRADMGRAAYLRFKCLHRTSNDVAVADYGFRIIAVDDVMLGVENNLRSNQ
ncbi:MULTISPECIES: hypothetical protein [unclassified Novosphingobium]|uniref:hypothetical protein n=1 Tax=unclassified Novosphingobium TaxID=2644732 RepID=UPI00146CB4D1|nr:MULTISPECIES: hypothetical protein [unclassified Novosphingobium]NMN03458.1 hypothetical protein [Novosphingobium sp. SG919]NMN86552.1 hypothetical protein [Novosphingobium sp. SG916]